MPSRNNMMPYNWQRHWNDGGRMEELWMWRRFTWDDVVIGNWKDPYRALFSFSELCSSSARAVIVDWVLCSQTYVEDGGETEGMKRSQRRKRRRRCASSCFLSQSRWYPSGCQAARAVSPSLQSSESTHPPCFRAVEMNSSLTCR